jgi:D-alanine-D-alanine ligase-like ATP-grasp enzyme
MNKAMVFIENQAFGTLVKLAKRSKERGFDNFVLVRPLFSHEKEQLKQYEQEHGHLLFDRLVETERWDFDHIKKAVEEFEKEKSLAGLICVGGFFTPDGLLGAHVATLAEERGLPAQSVEGLYRSNNKYLTRDTLFHAGLNTVDFGLATDEESLLRHAERIGYPVILKPINGCASQLVIKCENEQELIEGFHMGLKKLPQSLYKHMYSCIHRFPDRSGKMIEFHPLTSMLVEGYIPGREASVEIVVTETEVIPLLVHDKVLVTEGDRVVYEHLLVVPPVRFHDSEIQRMKEYAIKVAKATGIKNSLCHVELRYDEKTGPQLLEINPRVGGMLVTQSLETMIGFSVPDAILDLALGTFKPGTYDSISDLHAMFTLYPPHSGLFERVEGLDLLKRLPGILSTTLLFPEGSYIHGDDEEVFLLMGWMRGNSYEKILSVYEEAKKLVRFHVIAKEKVK